jgi:hypothetical protein
VVRRSKLGEGGYDWMGWSHWGRGIALSQEPASGDLTSSEEIGGKKSK